MKEGERSLEQGGGLVNNSNGVRDLLKANKSQLDLHPPISQPHTNAKMNYGVGRKLDQDSSEHERKNKEYAKTKSMYEGENTNLGKVVEGV